jgi:hypothetical protein
MFQAIYFSVSVMFHDCFSELSNHSENIIAVSEVKRMVNTKAIILFAAVSVLVVAVAGLAFAHPANAQTTSPTNTPTLTPQGTNGGNTYQYPLQGYGAQQSGYPYCYSNGNGRCGCGCGR